MDMSGEERITAPRDAVWAALNDPDILKSCLPRCKSLERTSPSELSALITIKFGLISASFSGDIVLSNVNAPESYTISAEGRGGIAGFAKGAAHVVLVEDGDETILRYTATAEIGGKLAQLGSKLVGSTSAKLARQFFADFNEKVSSLPA